MGIPLEIGKSWLTFGWLCRWSIRDAKSTCSVLVLWRSTTGMNMSLEKFPQKSWHCAPPFLSWCPWGWIQVHDEWDASKPQKNSELAIDISWPLRTVLLIISKAFYFEMRERGRNKFQTYSLAVCKICSHWCALPAVGSSTPPHGYSWSFRVWALRLSLPC